MWTHQRKREMTATSPTDQMQSWTRSDLCQLQDHKAPNVGVIALVVFDRASTLITDWSKYYRGGLKQIQKNSERCGCMKLNEAKEFQNIFCLDSLQMCVGDSCCVNLGGFCRGFSWWILLGTFCQQTWGDQNWRHPPPQKKNNQQLDNRNPREVCSAKTGPNIS